MFPSIVAWCVPAKNCDFSAVKLFMQDYGFTIESCTLNTIETISANIRVLHTDLYSSHTELQNAYERNKVPTLILVGTEAQEIKVFAYLSTDDDVCSGKASLEVIAHRMQRIIAKNEPDNLAAIDSLTGVLNRSKLTQDLTYYLKAKHSGEIGILMLDLDHFKVINDSFGHLFGDKILKAVGKRLQKDKAPQDQVYRIGGDEFVCLISRYNRQDIIERVQAIRQQFADEVFRIDEREVALTVSIGLTFLRDQSDEGEILKQADLAMYEAKSRNRNTLICYENLQALTDEFDRDLDLQHFENVTRVVSERVTTLITLMGRRLVEEARREANHDALTHLYNRRYFDERLQREIENAHKYRRCLTIALMDIDHFHDVNITYGWPTGDQVLRQFSELALQSIRTVDWIARYGGEEFCLVMPDTHLREGLKVAERIRAKFAAQEILSLDKRSFRVSVSIGLAELTTDMKSSIQLVQKASDALLVAKKSGRDRVSH